MKEFCFNNGTDEQELEKYALFLEFILNNVSSEFKINGIHFYKEDTKKMVKIYLYEMKDNKRIRSGYDSNLYYTERRSCIRSYYGSLTPQMIISLYNNVYNNPHFSSKTYRPKDDSILNILINKSKEKSLKDKRVKLLDLLAIYDNTIVYDVCTGEYDILSKYTSKEDYYKM